MLLCKSKKVIRSKEIPFPESKLSSASPKENFHQLYSKHCFFSYSFSLKLSLVFMSGKFQAIGDFTVSRLSQIPRVSGMDGVKSGESGAFLFFRHVSDFCDGGDHSRQMKIRFVQSGTSAMDLALLPIPITNKHGVSRKHE